MTYMEAMMGHYYEKWLGAMESKIESMHDEFRTWLIQSMMWELLDANGVSRKGWTIIEIFISIRLN
jgi:hypothetical protein